MTAMERKGLYFFIGTEAELIKLFPVLLILHKRQIPYYLIASGQNNIKSSLLLHALEDRPLDLELSQEREIKKNAQGLIKWFVRTSRHGRKIISNRFGQDNLENSVMVVHGDTVSTVMGAWLGRQLKMRVAHVEAGLRSYNWLNPFPEEIDRVITSRKASYHFAPGDIACENLYQAGAKGEIINTVYNTIVDSLAYANTIPCNSQKILRLQTTGEYFVFVLHRQENLANRKLVKKLLDCVHMQAKKTHCAFILHKPTEQMLKEAGYLTVLQADKNITLFERVEYFDFMKLLNQAAFVITDGGSNQEELSYMGKPCLIIRTNTERMDGLGENAVLYDGKLSAVDDFIGRYKDYNYPPIVPQHSPSEIIADKLCAATEGI